MAYKLQVDAPDRPDPDLATLCTSLAAGRTPAEWREALALARLKLTARFKAGEPVTQLVTLGAQLLDQLLIHVWKRLAPDLSERIALVAVGGYGRGELHPGSDVDLMLLLDGELPAGADTLLAGFIAALWDIGLEAGHSVRSVDDCRREAEADITVITTLMESRLLYGPPALLDAVYEATATARMWPSDRFFLAKRDEQRARHHRYDDTAYKLEPNVKESPGGLRDIQVIGWIARRHFGSRHFDELVNHNFLTASQLQLLREGQEFLWRVRFALHVLTGRREDRLLFDHQRRLAEMLGYEDARYTLAVEQLMQRYYRTVMDLSRLNEMLLQLFEEEILMDPRAAAVPLNARFQIRNGYLQAVNDRIFRQDPSALLEIFLLLQQQENIHGVSAHTVALIKSNLPLIDEEFRQNPRNHRLFMSILRAPAGVTHELRRMNLYGVLGLYIPAFGRIVGRMQYDLFHAYTVDEHTLFVVSNLRRFALRRFDDEYPHCSRLMQSFEKPETVYLAGLFHDIAKGRGGDHSELGAVDAESFCLEHGMSPYDARTVAWLVRNHLILSMTAQKKDISDPVVVSEFAARIGDQMHLDYLYCLTVADVRGTNPRLWNSWKATLFRDLYELTSQAFRRGLENPIDREQLIDETQSAARAVLKESAVLESSVQRVWSLFNDDYFLRCRAEEIAWHTEILADSDIASATGLVAVRKQPDGDGMEAMLYTPRSKHTFAHVTAVLDELGTTIVDARIVPIANGYSLETFVFLETDKRTVVDTRRIEKVQQHLTRVLSAKSVPAKVMRPAPRQVRMFSTRTEILSSEDLGRRRTVLEIVAADRPGLLSKVGQVFVEYGIDIETAKILTIGERAEDVFYVVDQHGEPLSDALCTALKADLVERLDQRN
jgi:[protein-PII] uridylyltransferase